MYEPFIDESAGIEVAHLCDFRIRFEDNQIHQTPMGLRSTYVIHEGEVTGERLGGRFLPGGGDWVVSGTDGVAHMDVRATFAADDGGLVHVTSTGRAVLGAEQLGGLMAGDFLGYRDMYARASPLFETGDEGLAWLNGVHTVALMQFGLREVHYKIFEVR